MFGKEPTIATFRGPWGIPVEIKSSILMLAVLFVGVGAAAASDVMHGLILFGMIVVSIFLHELGHAWGAWVQNVPVHRVVIYGGGGFCQHGKTSARKSELIIAMGPLVNLALWALASLGAYLMFSVEPAELSLQNADSWGNWYKFALYLDQFALINLILFGLNLVPVSPLDGGKLLYLTLLRFLKPEMALRLAGAVGLLFAVLWFPGMLLLYFQFGLLLLFFPSVGRHYRMMRGQTA